MHLYGQLGLLTVFLLSFGSLSPLTCILRRFGTLCNIQSSSDSVTASYRALERQKPLEISEHAGAEDKSNNPVRPPIWKVVFCFI